MNHENLLGVPHLLSTNVLWWDSQALRCEQVEGYRFDECLDQFRRDQDNKTPTSNLSINIVIIKDEPIPSSERGTRPAGLSITRDHFNGLVTTFHLSPSFRKWKSRETGYHDYIKDNPGNHDESLIFAVQSPRLRDTVTFFTMRISPTTNSVMCIITVPTGEHMNWLRRELTGYHSTFMTCPINLFNLLCRRLDHENGLATSSVLSMFEQQEIEMDNSCRSIQANNDNKMYKKHRNVIIDLNKLNVALMTLGCTIDFELSALNFAKGIMDRYKKLYETSISPNNLPRISNEQDQIFNDEIESLETAARLRQDMRTYAQKRAEHMVSLLSAHNLQRDMITNQRISANTRNITILGSLFIPPTFVATGTLEVVQPLGWIFGVTIGGLILVTLILLLAYMWPKVLSRDREGSCPRSDFNEGATTRSKTTTPPGS
ncbi:hypothetical protein NPX13_g7663 [Xylaria arbuscula]|uniref:Uncharacterized protein n=1 Tax=Xylaria arbuscula TaxID=114810 RepID=A0A9W8N9X4_9PEZI|nr:hypothetical protein NPX13_g7663 [Xylaria arbuscula]